MPGRPLHELPRNVLFALFAYFTLSGAFWGAAGVGRFIDYWDWLNDLHFFYDAAGFVVSDEVELLYDAEGRVARGYAIAPNDGVFPLPASVALLFWPLRLVGLEAARWVFMAISIACLTGVVGLAYRWSRDWIFATLVLLATASLFTTYEALRFSQLSPVIALICCGALIAMHRERALASGLLVGLLAIKPSIALAPLLLLARPLEPRRAAIAGLVAATIVFIVPQALVGTDGLADYARQLDRFRDEAFQLHGVFTAGAAWMLNWNGFFGRLLVWDPEPLLVAPFWLATALLALKVWLKGQLLDSWLAALLATLLIVPHAVWYDWLLLLGVAPFVLYANRSLPLLGLLLALHFAVSLDSYFIVTTGALDRYFFLTTPIAAAILGYLAFARPPIVESYVDAYVVSSHIEGRPAGVVS